MRLRLVVVVPDFRNAHSAHWFPSRKEACNKYKNFDSNWHVVLLLRSFKMIFLYKMTLAQSKKAECLHESSFDMVGE